MLTHVDDMTAAQPPRKRWLVTAAALILPLVLIVGAAAWFVHTYVMPPSISFAPLAFSPAPVEPPATSPSAPAEPSPEPETTGSATPATPAPAPQFRYTTNSSEVWAAVPLPGPPRTIDTPSPEPEVVTRSIETTGDPVPLPPRRPRVTEQATAGAVPLPRPRPGSAAN